MRLRFKVIGLAVCLAVSSVMFTVFAGPACAASKTIKLGITHNTDSEFYKASAKFEELVESGTNGEIDVQIFPNGQIGSEGEMIEGVNMGTVDATLVGTSSIAKFLPSFEMFNLPYLFRDYDHVDKVLLGEIGDGFAKQIAAKGIKVLSFWESGFRHYVNSKREIKEPADMKGLTIRTPDSAVQIAIAKALGASPISMAFGELYLACQQGVVDGQEGSIFTMRAEKMFEVQKYMVLDGHVYTVQTLVMNPALFDSLTPEQQKVLMNAAHEAGLYERKILRDGEKDSLEFIKTTGKMLVYETPDKEQWRNMTAPVYEEFGAKFDKAIIDKILAVK